MRHTIIALLLLSSVAFAQVPRTISYQGVLTTAAGAPLADGNHQLQISLHAEATGGGSVYTETQTIPVVGGVFHAIIGSVTPFPESFAFDRKYFLAVRVDGGAELAPRTPLTSVPYAFRSGIADALAPGAAGVVTRVNGQSGDLTFIGGGSTTVTPSGNNILIYSSGGTGGTGVQGVQNTDGSIAITNPNGPVATLSIPDGALGPHKLDPSAATAGDAPVYNGASVEWRKVSTSDGIQQLINTDNTIDIANPNGPAATIGIKPASIGTGALTDNAVTPAKISAAGSATGQALLSDGTTTPVWGYPSASDLQLPFAKTQADAGALFSVTNSGDGKAAFFQGDNTNSYTGVLEATTAGSGLVAKFSSTNTAGFGSNAVQISSAGSSIGLVVYGGGGGGWFLPGYPGAVYATSGIGSAIQGSSASGIGTYGGASTGTGVYAQARGTGNALIAVSESGGVATTTTGNIAVFKNTVNAGNVARIDNTGKAYFNGGTQNSGADLAELFVVRGGTAASEPGDVLVISTGADREVEASEGAYSTLVAGVHATRPGIILTEEHIDADPGGMAPVGVIGVIPTKVCTENGPIHRGDLLVTSSRRGCAMKADQAKLGFGMVIGKALENFTGDGTGTITVLVSVR
jgi:hypothetical protein